MLFPIVSFFFALSLARVKSQAPVLWRADLQWSELTSKLSPNAALVDTSPENYLAECLDEFKRPVNTEGGRQRSNYALIDQPSGLCMNALFCAFERCSPIPYSANTTLVDRFDTFSNGSGINGVASALFSGIYSDKSSNIREWVEDTSNPSYDLPSKVLFPVVASDVVAAIEFAKEHKLEISVKNSGHSYAGASNKRNTILLNMNRYTEYATLTGVVDCEADFDSQDLTDQPCSLSLAKGKSAVIRVGGGENWDQVYRAVKKSNEESEEGYKYHVVGGAAGSVSPMGWTFQGGLSGSTAGRIFGLGVDQVLQLEMVLPNGYHVKFGPTEWEEADGYDVPKTISVSGVCRSNAEEIDENKWVWEECPEEAKINFNDLWFAVRGGGGGTWGVVTSVYLQIHEYLSYQIISPVIFIDYTCFPFANYNESQTIAINRAYQTFQIKYLLDPSSINVTEADSNGCGWPASGSMFHCYGKMNPGQAFETAWNRYLESISQNLAKEEGIPISDIEAAVNCKDFAVIENHTDYAGAFTFEVGEFAGRAIDSPAPSLESTSEIFNNILLPKKWILENIDLAVSLLPPDPSTYRAFGGKISKATSDQLNSLSKAHRDAGYMAYLYHDNLDLFFSYYFSEIYDTSDKENFPGYIGSNHAGPNTRGPLKSDWTKACPIEWTYEERDEKCISLQEAIYGTKTLKRLEEIKKNLDPNYMFDCYGCIGNNRAKDVDPVLNPGEDPGSDPDENPGSDPDETLTSEDNTSSIFGMTNHTKGFFNLVVFFAFILMF